MQIQHSVSLLNNNGVNNIMIWLPEKVLLKKKYYMAKIKTLINDKDYYFNIKYKNYHKKSYVKEIITFIK